MRVCFMLAISKQPLSASQLVKQTDVSVKYLEKLLSMLKQGGIVLSSRGKSGGYVLSRGAGEITVGDMLSALEDGFDGPECVSGACPDIYCPNRNLFALLDREINRTFGGITLKDIIDDYRSSCGAGEQNV